MRRMPTGSSSRIPARFIETTTPQGNLRRRPAGQAAIFLAYPASRQRFLQCLFAMGSVVAPATIAPALEGWLLDSHSWFWIFFCVVPVALAAAGLLIAADDQIPARAPRRVSHALYDVADALANDVLVSDLSCLNIENGIDPHGIAFLPCHHPQRLNSAAAAGFLMGIDRRE